MNTTDYEDDYDYTKSLNDIKDHVENISKASHTGYCKEAACAITIILNVIIFLLGIVGNGAVIWITGFKMKKSVNTTWYLSLALSDFIFCATLPFTISGIVMDSGWIFGLFMCKFTSFVMTINMYSSIFILVIISVDRCITVKFPVWAQNQRTIKKASLVVMMAWFVSALLSIPPAKFRDLTHDSEMVKCYTNYTNHHRTIVFTCFTFGFLVPFLTISTCYSVLICKLKANQVSKFTKPIKIMTLLITIYFVCWLPFHITSILEIGKTLHDHVFHTAQEISGTLATANSFMNPFLYAFMAKDLKKKCYSFLSKIESAIDEKA